MALRGRSELIVLYFTPICFGICTSRTFYGNQRTRLVFLSGVVYYKIKTFWFTELDSISVHW